MKGSSQSTTLCRDSRSKHTPGPWGDGNEALLVKIDRERPWASTVFRKGHDGTEANALLAMAFGATVEEAVANARMVAVAPDGYELAAWIDLHYGDCDLNHVDFRVKSYELARAFLAKAGGTA